MKKEKTYWLIVLVLVIIFAGINSAVKVFNHFGMSFALIPVGATIAGSYFIIKSILKR